MTEKYTPGPWQLECGDHTHRYAHVKDADDRTIHYKYGSGTKRDADRDEVNARLIAAAPDLLEALEALLAEAEDIFVCMADATGINRHALPPQFASASAAIAKALG